LNSLNRFSKHIQKLNFIKVRLAEAELLHANRRTDMTKLIVALRNFANAPKTRKQKLQTSLKKVKCSRYRPGVAQRVGRGIALLFHDRGTRRG